MTDKSLLNTFLNLSAARQARIRRAADTDLAPACSDSYRKHHAGRDFHRMQICCDCECKSLYSLQSEEFASKLAKFFLLQ